MTLTLSWDLFTALAFSFLAAGFVLCVVLQAVAEKNQDKRSMKKFAQFQGKWISESEYNELLG